MSTLDYSFPRLPLPPPTANAFSQCIRLPPPPLPPSTAAASPHRCCAPPSPLRPQIPAAFPLSYGVPSSLLPFVTGSGPPYQGSDPRNGCPFFPLVLPPPLMVLRRPHPCYPTSYPSCLLPPLVLPFPTGAAPFPSELPRHPLKVYLMH